MSTAPDAAPADYVPVRLSLPRIERMERADGAVLLRSLVPLRPLPRQLGVVLRAAAERFPDNTFLAEREAGGGWRRLTYAEAAGQAARIAQALLDRGHGPDRPVAALCDNSVHLGLLMLGAQQAGIPVMPVSPAYSLMSTNHATLRYVVATMRPSLIYVSDLGPFSRALAALDLTGIELVADAAHPDWPQARPFADLLRTTPGGAAAEAFAAVDGDTVAKILLTSGSTGMPKGVITTHRMLCANMVMEEQIWPFLTERPPVIVDWLPWNHVFGSNHNLSMVLRHGGSLYIDRGRPVPGRFEETVRNMREVACTMLLNVPRAFEMLTAAMERDADLCRHVIGNIDVIFYAGAALPLSLWRRLEALAIGVRGRRVPMASALGSTETAPTAIKCHWPNDVPGNLGVPIPGVEVKLVPNGGKLEFRCRGPNVSPGYYRQPELTATYWDEEGYFKMGDAVRFVDPDRPEAGLLFDGRVSENFKLTTGTWVHVGTLRPAAITAASPVIQDAVVTGDGRNAVGLLIFPSLDGCRSVAGTPDAPLGEAAFCDRVRAHLVAALAAHNAAQPGSSTRIVRAMIMDEPPSVDANEITDKGYINQRAVLARRAALVERLYADDPDAAVIVIA